MINRSVMDRVDLINDAPELDSVFAALADPTRRAILARLRQGGLSVGDIAAPLTMSQPAVTKHLNVLERASLIIRQGQGRKRIVTIAAAPMADAMIWLVEFRGLWGANFDQLDAILHELQGGVSE